MKQWLRLPVLATGLFGPVEGGAVSAAVAGEILVQRIAMATLTIGASAIGGFFRAVFDGKRMRGLDKVVKAHLGQQALLIIVLQVMESE